VSQVRDELGHVGQEKYYLGHLGQLRDKPGHVGQGRCYLGQKGCFLGQEGAIWVRGRIIGVILDRLDVSIFLCRYSKVRYSLGQAIHNLGHISLVNSYGSAY